MHARLIFCFSYLDSFISGYAEGNRVDTKKNIETNWGVRERARDSETQMEQIEHSTEQTAFKLKLAGPVSNN